MPNKEDNWVPISWYCPNCSSLITRYQNQRGDIKLECKNCRTVMIRTLKSKQHARIDMYASKLSQYET